MTKYIKSNFSGSAMTHPFFASTRTVRMLEFGLVFYLAAFAFEGPIRYVLFKHGLDNAIVLRDAVLMVLMTPTFFVLDVGAITRKYLLVFVSIIALHGIIIYFNFGNIEVIGYCAKEFMPILFGAILARLSGSPSKFALYALAFLWAATVFGLLWDKFVATFPWTGLSTVVGGLTVDVGKDWYTHGIDKRAGGFTRSSVHAAIFLPLLSMVLLGNTRSGWRRLAIMIIACGSVWLTTQKGTIVACALVTFCLLLPPRASRSALFAVLLLGLLATISLPLLLSGANLASHGYGVFSLSSLALRMSDTWPGAFAWIDRYEVFPFGVGLGGIWGAQRLYATVPVNSADNMFLFLYASFGVMAAVYVGYLLFLCLSAGKDGSRFSLIPIAIVAFHFVGGTVVSMIEDQSSCIFLGLAVGYLLNQRHLRMVLQSQDDPRVTGAAQIYG